MNRNFPYGLGWQPDLPDYRDKNFTRARLHAVEASKSLPQAHGTGEPSSGVHAVVTHQAWKASHVISRAMDQTLKSASSVVGRRYSAALTLAFGDEDDGHPLKETVPSGINPSKRSAKPDSLPNRPILLATPPDPNKLPKRVDLRPFMSPIENQEQLGSCTAHAVVGLVEYLQIATRGGYLNGSRLFVYKTTRNLLEWAGDRGAYLRETIKALRLFGICPERFLPYDSVKFDDEPSAFCYAFAANYRAISYYRLSGLTEIKQTLAQGYPVAFGFTCFESLGLPHVRATGVIPYPVSSERAVGGHAVLAVGYIDEGDGSNPENPGHLIIRNSWGADWGKKGYGFLPYTYLHGNAAQAEPMSEDCWTMTGMEIPALSESQAAPFALGDGENPVK